VGGLRVVAVPARPWRPYAAPAAFLLAVTIAVAVARPALRHHTQPARSAAPKSAAAARPAKAVYRVRAGDTLGSIAARTHVPLPRLRRLNPGVEPTALFIGQKIRLR
jgi:LysM repeat protein